MNTERLRALGLFDARVPRYTSYPPATAFTDRIGADFQARAIAALDPDEPVSVYIHIPFCERLCWFCACRTQGTKSLDPVEHYLRALRAELAILRDIRPEGLRMGRLHWGGGTPTILPPDLIRQLATDIMKVIPPADPFEFSVEIDPTLVDAARIAALAEAGMTRASMGIQDFDPQVQSTIGRRQSFEETRHCVAMLRAADITSLNADLVYGLPHQTPKMISATVAKVLMLDPDRVALFGYAHVPHMSKRQKLIPDTALPSDTERLALSELATEMFLGAGHEAIGIDHFAKPGDGLALAKRNGTLRRNFQGYTEDSCQTLIGLGASSISRFAQGYVQNATATAAYQQRIDQGTLAGYRGHQMTREDTLRAAVIEQIMCSYSVDLNALRNTFGATAIATLEPDHDAVCQRFGSAVSREAAQLRIASDPRFLARLVARMYDRCGVGDAVYSRAS